MIRRLELRVLRGPEGVLTLGEELPFVPRRWFTISGVPPSLTRGNHAHRACEQLFAILAGRCTVDADDGKRRERLVLEAGQGLYVPPLVWTAQSEWSNDACLLVFASHPYDPADYVRDYDEFKKLIQIPD